jgi:hypothetical protein
MVFDNSKLRSIVPGYQAVIPFEQGAREIVAWHDEDPSRQQVDARLDEVMDKLISTYRPSPSQPAKPAARGVLRCPRPAPYLAQGHAADRPHS